MTAVTSTTTEQKLNRTRTSKSKWNAILPHNNDSSDFNNHRDCNQQLQMHLTDNKKVHGVRLQYVSSAIQQNPD